MKSSWHVIVTCSKIGSGLPSNRPPTRCLDPCHQGHRQRAGRLKLQNWPNLSCAAHYHHHLLHLLSAFKAVGCSRLPIVCSLQSQASIITHSHIPYAQYHTRRLNYPINATPRVRRHIIPSSTRCCNNSIHTCRCHSSPFPDTVWVHPRRLKMINLTLVTQPGDRAQKWR